MWSTLETCFYISTLFVFIYGGFCLYVSFLNIWCVGRRKLKRDSGNSSQSDIEESLEEGQDSFGVFWPPITIQVFISLEDSKQQNERVLFTRLLQRLGSLDYPVNRLQIQLLEEIESEQDDECMDVLSMLASHAPLQSFSHVLTIPWCGQTKDEVLKEALKSANGDYIFVLESSSIPEATFLKDCLKIFSRDSKIGLVQPIFKFLNSDESFLTRFQFMLNNFNEFDHQEVRLLQDDVTKFIPSSLNEMCGFVGVWKNSCIEECSDSLLQFTGVELAHRAQLKGWKVHSHNDLKLELNFPNSMQKYKSQQYQISKDATRCFRKFFFSALYKQASFKQKLIQLGQLAKPLLFIPFFIIMSCPIIEVLTNSRVTYMRENYLILGLSFIGMFTRLLLSQVINEQISWRNKLKNLCLLPFGILFSIGMIVSIFEGVFAGLLILPGFLRSFARIQALRSKKSVWSVISRIGRSKLETVLCISFFCLLYFGNSLATNKYNELSWTFLQPNSIFAFYSTEALFLYLYYAHCFLSSSGLLVVIYWSLDSHIPSQSLVALSEMEQANFIWNQVNFARVLFSFVGISFIWVFYNSMNHVR